MTKTPARPRSQGMTMIAAYRAQRLSQRPVLRSNLHQSHLALRQSRDGLPRQFSPQSDISCIAHPDTAPKIDPHPEKINGSIFANLINTSEQRQDSLGVPFSQTQHCNSTMAIPDEQTGLTSAPEPNETAPTAYDPPLAEIGFGPGMVIRLSQVGVQTLDDLARCNVPHLHEALGDVSHLVDIKNWIDSARQRASRCLVPG